MKHPEKWRDTTDPFQLQFENFELVEVLGYPHAGNDVFYAKGLHSGETIETFIKVARQNGADIKNEVNTIRTLNHPLAPEIIDYDAKDFRYVVTRAKDGERLSAILGRNPELSSMDFMHEYGRTLAQFHGAKGDFLPVKDRKFFHIPERAYFEDEGLEYVCEYLEAHRPEKINTCFCHGDFHYANILWDGDSISGVLDFELSGIGNREFDIAWALILRPGQQFLDTEAELLRFIEGYRLVGCCDMKRVRYYMILIYSHFYKFGKSEPGYGAYVRAFFGKWCNATLKE